MSRLTTAYFCAAAARASGVSLSASLARASGRLWQSHGKTAAVGLGAAVSLKYFGIPAVFAAAVVFGVFTGFEGDFFVFGVPEGDIVGLGAAGAERADFGVVGGQRGGVAGLAV